MPICQYGLYLTSILRFNSDDALPLRTEALCGSSLDLKLVGHVLSQVGNGQTGFSAIAVHLEGTHITCRKQETEVKPNSHNLKCNSFIASDLCAESLTSTMQLFAGDYISQDFSVGLAWFLPAELQRIRTQSCEHQRSWSAGSAKSERRTWRKK